MIEEKMAKVKCNGCKQDFDCPESMRKADSHYCAICCELQEQGIEEKDLEKTARKARPEIEADWSFGDVIDAFTEMTFPVFWQDEKKEVKKLSKREIAEASYSCGVAALLELFTFGTPPEEKKEMFKKLAEVMREAGENNE